MVSSGSDPGNGLGLLNDDGVVMPLIVTPSSPKQGPSSLLLERRERSNAAAF